MMLSFFTTHRYADAYRNEMVAFVDCAHEGKTTPVGVEDGRAAYLIGKAAKASMESGAVSWIWNRPCVSGSDWVNPSSMFNIHSLVYTILTSFLLNSDASDGMV